MRLLLVEDNIELAEAVIDAFRRNSIECDHADCAADAELLILTRSYSAIVLDLGLPDEDGLELLSRLRGNGKVEPIIVLTARGSADNRVEGLRRGADDYLVKPFLFDELLARVEAIMRRQGGYVEQSISVGDLILDTQNFEVKSGAKPIDLSVREAQILATLMRRNGHVTPRGIIADQLFGVNDDLGSNAVEVYVHRLRKKLESAAAGVAIKTVRGVGYLLMAAA